MSRIRMTEADWQRNGLVCPSCDYDSRWTFIGAAADGVWSVVRCCSCLAEIEVSPVWVDSHLCECGTAYADRDEHHVEIQRDATSDPWVRDWQGHDELRDGVATWEDEMRTLDSMRGPL